MLSPFSIDLPLLPTSVITRQESKKGQRIFMDIQLKENKGLSRELTVNIPVEDVTKAIEKQCTEVGKQMKVDGFRPGKVPVHVVKQRHGEAILEQTRQNLMNHALAEAIQKHSLAIAGDVHMDKPPELKEHEAFSFTAKVEVFPNIEPAGLSGITLTREKAKPTDQMIKDALANLQERLRTFKDKAEAAAKGDRVTFTGQGYTLKNDKEEAFEGGNLENFPVIIGSGSLIPGFEDQLTGLKTGDKKDVQVTFPKEYHAPDLAGQKAVFKIEVNKVEAPEDIPLDDAFAQTLGQESMEVLTDALSKGIQQDLDRASEQRLKRALFDHLDAKNTFDLPENLVTKEIEGLAQTQIQRFMQQGLPTEQLSDMLGKLKEEFKEIGARRVKLGLLLAEIAKQKSIRVEEAEIRKAVLDEVERAGPQGQQVRDFYSTPQNRQQLVGPLLEEKVTQLLMADAKIDETEIKAEDLLKEFE
jgi:trigger factor